MADQEVDTTLTTAISKAVDTHREDLGQDKSGEQVEGNKISEDQKEDKKDDSKEEKTPDGDDSQDLLDREQGRILVQALRNPEQASFVIDYLARQAGYTKQTIETKQDVKEAQTDINAILERNLGEEFKFLAPKLAPAIKETLEAMLASKNEGELGNLKARIEKQELKEIQSETLRTHTSLSQEWFGADDMPKNVIQAMSQAMDDFPPSDPNMSAERYYRKIFSLVAGELELSKVNKGRGSTDRNSKIDKNKSDATARNLASQNRGVAPNVDGGNPRRYSLKDAVSLALEQVEQASRK